MFDVDFSLAIYNKTGKFFIGRDVISNNRDLISDVYYWRFVRKELPKGLPAKLIGRAQALESNWRAEGRPTVWPCRRCVRPTIHLDPATIAYTDLGPADIVLCHDLGPVTHPSLFSVDVSTLYRHAYQRVAERSPRIVCVSRASQQALNDFLGCSIRSEVVYPPIRKDLVQMTPIAVPDVAPPFFLSVGSIGNRKNQKEVIRAFAASGLAEKGMSYVICGSREPGAEEVVALSRSTPGVKLLPYVSDGELAWLYRTASGFVLMSLLEGFGVPVAEAIDYRLVPVVSQGSVLEEVAGAGSLSADPGDARDIAEKLIHLAEMGAEEKEQRVALLTQSILRFSMSSFTAGWRRVLTDRK